MEVQVTIPVEREVTIKLTESEAKKLLALLGCIGGYTDGLHLDPNVFSSHPPTYYGYSGAEIRDGVQNDLCAKLNDHFKFY